MHQHRFIVEAGFDLLRRQVLAHIFVLAEVLIEIFSLQPAFHGVALHPAVRSIPERAFADQRQQHAGAVDQAAGHVQVFQHFFRIDQQPVDQIDGFVQDIIQRRGRIRQHHPLYGRMGDIPFMPQRNIFKSGQYVALHQAGHAADALAAHRVPFVGHSRRSLLFRAEIFFRFPHFGTLQVTDFQRHLG